MPDQPYTDEDVELAIRTLWACSNGRRLRAEEPTPRGSVYRDEARAVLDALAAAGRLVSPGSEVREDWSVVFGPDDALDCSSEATARRRAERDGGTVEFRRVITTPWGPADSAEPAPKERTDG